MRITMIICTRNRAEQLRRVMESAASMRSPDSLEWELIVVDNGSTDDTRAVVKGFSDRLPVTYAFEAEAGLSKARNRGVSLARGDYVCWTDDDVKLDPEWLSAYADAFAEHPEAAFFGGPIELVMEGTSPTWFEKNRALLASTLAERRVSAQAIELQGSAALLPYGANFAARAAELREHPFDPNLGVSPTQRRLGEESAVLAAISLEGGRGRWVPGAKVFHIIPEDRRTLDYLFSFQRSSGESAAYLVHCAPPELSRFLVSRSATMLMRSRLLLAMASTVTRSGLALASPFGRSALWIRLWLRLGYYRGGRDFLNSRSTR